jgi:hypothetical protein
MNEMFYYVSLYNQRHIIILADFFVGAVLKSYEGSAILNLSTLYSRWRHLDVLLLICALKNKISCSSTFDSVMVHKPTRIITDYSILMVNHNFKASSYARCVSVASAICKNTDIFNKDYISLTDIL